MNLLAVVLALLAGRARGGRVQDLLDYPLRGHPHFLVSLLVQVFLGTRYAESLAWLRPLAPLLNLASMGLLLWAIGLNWRLAAARPLALGVLANLVAIFANGGRMPVSPAALVGVAMPASRVAYLASGRSLLHRMAGPDTVWPWLGDWLYLPPPVPRSPVFSLGDVLITTGLFLLVYEIMGQAGAARRASPDAGAPASTQVDTPGPGC